MTVMEASARVDDAQEMEAHLSDLERIVSGIQTFVGLSFEQIRQCYGVHEEDKLCDIPRADGKGVVLCTRDGIQAIVSMAERYASSQPNREAYSVSDIAGAIRHRILRAAVEEKSDEALIRRVLREAKEEAERGHIVRTFHFPCVLVSERTRMLLGRPGNLFHSTVLHEFEKTGTLRIC